MKQNWKHLFTTQFLGVLNDNILKSLICFIAIYWVTPENKSLVISAASAAMVLPFILLSPLAGYISQTRERQQILEAAKLAELPIMTIALIGFGINSVWLVILAMFFMGIQSALYSPSKYGLVRDIADGKNMPKQLGVMELLSFSGVLIGTLVAGYLADLNQFQITLIGTTVLVIAFLGYYTSKKISLPKSIKEIEVAKIFNPIQFFKQNCALAKPYKGVNNAVIGLAVFWLIGSMLQMNLLVHCPEVLELSNTQTGWITAFVAVGIGAGCWASGRIMKNRLEIGLIPFAGIGLTVFSFLLGSELTIFGFITLLMLNAFCGGLFKVPLNAWIQERTPNEHLGSILAYSNMIVFLFILISALLFGVLQQFFNTYQLFTVLGCIAAITTVISFKVLFNQVIRFIVWAAAKCIYKLETEGTENIPVKTGAILTSNHVGLLDALLIASTAPRNFRFVMHHKVFNHKILHPFFKQLNMIPAGRATCKKSLNTFTQQCKTLVEKGHIVCIFPEGQLSRNGQLQRFKNGIVHLSQEIDAPIIPMHIGNAVGTPLTYKIGTNRTYNFCLKNWKQQVYLTIGEPIIQLKGAFNLRQTTKELEVINTIKQIKEQDISTHLKLTVAKLFGNQPCTVKFDTINLSNLIVNTPDFTIADISKQKIKLIGSKDGSIGRAITGVTTKIVNEQQQELPTNTPGILMIKSGYQTHPTWEKTNLTATMDEDGFITINH